MIAMTSSDTVLNAPIHPILLPRPLAQWITASGVTLARCLLAARRSLTEDAWTQTGHSTALPVRTRQQCNGIW